MARSNGRGRHAAPTTSFSTIATRTAVATVSATAVITASMTAANADSTEPSHAIAKVDITAAGNDVAAVTTPEITVSTDAAAWSVAGENAVAEVQISQPAPEPVVRQRPAEPQRSSRTTQRQAPAPAPVQAAPAPQAQVQAEAPAAAPVQASGIGNKIVAIARQYSGVRYVHGGRSPSGWDCSGFTSYVYAQVGISLPVSSRGQAGVGRRIPASQARPGDLVYWPGHVGIYTGNGNHIAARNPRAGTHEGPVYGRPIYIRVVG